MAATSGTRPTRATGSRSASAARPSARRRRPCSSGRSATASSSPSTAATSSRSTRRPAAPRHRRPGPARQPPVRGQAVRARRAAPGRRPGRVRPHERGAGGDGVQPLRRGPPRPDAPGAVPAVGIPQSVLACGTEGVPLDALTAARLARDGERPSPLRHMCSGQHTVVRPAREARRLATRDVLAGRPPGARGVRRGRRGRRSASGPTALVTGIDGCGILTYAFPLREVARAYAILADPDGDPGRRPARRARAAPR